MTPVPLPSHRESCSLFLYPSFYIFRLVWRIPLPLFLPRRFLSFRKSFTFSCSSCDLLPFDWLCSITERTALPSLFFSFFSMTTNFVSINVSFSLILSFFLVAYSPVYPVITTMLIMVLMVHRFVVNVSSSFNFQFVDLLLEN